MSALISTNQQVQRKIEHLLRSLLILVTLFTALMMIVVDGISIANNNNSNNNNNNNNNNNDNNNNKTLNDNIESNQNTSANINKRFSNNVVRLAPSLLMDYNQVLINHNKKASLAKPKPSISYNEGRTINRLSSGVNSTSAPMASAIRYSPRKLDQATITNMPYKVPMHSSLPVLTSKYLVGNVPLNNNMIVAGLNKTKITVIDQHRSAAAEARSGVIGGPTKKSAPNDDWPKKYKEELEYFRNLGDPLQTNKRPRWAHPCNPHRLSFNQNVTMSRQEKISIAGGDGIKQKRKRRSIGRQQQNYAIYDQSNQIMARNGGVPLKDNNGRFKQRVKTLHGSALYTVTLPPREMAATYASIRPNVTLLELQNTKDKLIGVLRVLFTKTVVIKDLSIDLKDKLIDEYFGVREDFERDMESYRQTWLPQVRTLLSAQQTSTQIREALDVAKDYLQYFAVGFEQSIIDQIEIGDSHLLEFMKIESSVLDLLCTVDYLIRLNNLHHHHQQLRIRSIQQNITMINADQLQQRSSDHFATQVDEKNSYIRRSVMDVRQRKEKQRAHRYVRDYMIVRDYITLIDFIKKLVTDLVTDLIKTESSSAS